MSGTVTDKDQGYAKMLKALGPMGGLRLGVQGKEASLVHKDAKGKAATVGKIAEIHELGLGVPVRSWLRGWVDENKDTIIADSKAALQLVIMGKFTRKQALDLLGVKWVAAIQKRISDGGWAEPLSALTIKRKGSSKPLIDTGLFRSAITHLALEATA